MKKRIVSLIMALALCLSLLPMAALAEENGPEESLPQEEPLLEEPEEPADPEEQEEPAEPEELEEPGEPEEPTPEGEPVQPARLAGESAAPVNTGHSHPICGANCEHSGSSKHDDVTFAKEIKTDNIGQLYKGVDKWSASGDVLELEGGSYYLTSNITVDKTIKITGTVNLCLHGNSITSSAAGSAVFEVSDNATFTLTNCNGTGIITHTPGVNGRGVAVGGGGIFNMYGGTISGNTATTTGGGVFAKGTFNMCGGTISGNTATGIGGGVYVSGSTFNMSGGTITGNTVTSTSGGGVYVASNSIFTMSGAASITGNSAGSNGGGVNVDGTSTFTMSGTASITGNTAGKDTDHGGGVYVGDSATFNVSGAVNITGNVKGGTISNGTLAGGTVNNVYLSSWYRKAAVITIADVLTEGAKIGVTLNTDYGDAPFTNGWNSKMGDKNPSDYFISDIDGYTPVLSSGNEVTLQEAHTHTVCKGTTPCTDPTHTSSHGDTVTFTKIWVDNGALKIGDTPWNDSGAKYYSLGAGSYYLDSNITVSGTIAITGDVNLCLNGHTITSSGNESPVITVNGNAKLTLCDCSDNGKGEITHASDVKGQGQGVYVCGTFNMYGGAISGNNTTYNGGGVNVVEGTFNMYGGAISKNKAQNGGGGVNVVEGTFNMYGGAISGNFTPSSGGGVSVVGGTFNMSGGTISSTNGATGNGGGVYVSGGTFTMSGTASIIDNKATGNGGGVYMNGGTFTMSGTASISKNEATSSGGGVYMNNGTFVMKDGTITGNSAATNRSSLGGGVYVYGGTFTMEKGSITGNNAKAGGGVYVDGHGELEMSGGSITGNNADINGGGVWMQNEFRVSGAVTVTGNVKGGTITNGNLAGGMANNVYLSEKNKVITIAGALELGAKIGVNLTNDGTGTVTSGWKEKMGDKTPSAYFTHDGGRYGVDVNADGEVVLTAHQHNWTYEASGNIITATCKNCPENSGDNLTGGTYTVTAPAVTVDKPRTYDGTAKPATAEFKPTSGVTGLLPIGAITYKQGNTILSEAPTNAGTYTASITVGGATASVEYKIAKAEQTITVPNDKSITRNGVAVDISKWASAAGVTDGTPAGFLTYALDGNPDGVSLTGNELKANPNASVDAVTIKVTAASTTNYKQAEKTFTVEVVNKIDATVIIEGMPATVTYGDIITLQASQTGDDGRGGRWNWDFDNKYFEAAEPNIASGTIKLRVIKAGEPGKKNITAAYTSNTHQGSGSVTVSEVKRASVTIVAKDQDIYVNDAVPDLSHPVKGTHYTITGDTIEGITMQYQKDGEVVTPDVKKEGTYDIVITVPVRDDSNYDIVCHNGTLTISRRSSGTVIIITPSQQPTDNTTNPNTGAAAGSIGYVVCVLAAAGALCAAKKLTKKDEK